MSKITFLLLAFVFSFGVYAQTSSTPYYSAARRPGENFQTAARRFYSSVPQSRMGPITARRSVLNHASAEQAAVDLNSIYARNMTTWTERELLERFNYIRDLKFLNDPEPNYVAPRRSSWLYPHDGCFARAHLAVLNMYRHNVSLPYKIFIFGDLEVKTQNSSTGSVSWWYHVVPAVRTNGEIYIIDPAIEPRYPLKLVQWVDKMTTDRKNVRIAICSPFAYNPSSLCSQGQDQDFEGAVRDQGYYLQSERSQLEILGRISEKELGPYPPWAQL